MRNPLDLNNLPEDFARDHDKQPLNHSSLAAPGSYNRKKKNVRKDESRKVYECRFCSLKFCKSQALGGHMNRHRQERETETLNRARQLVFGNHSLYRLGNQPMVNGGYHHEAGYNNMGSTIYPTRLFSGTSTTVLSPASPTQHHKSESGKDYIMGHGCSTNQPFILQNMGCIATPPPEGSNNYTCIGAPVGQAFTLTGGSSGSQ